MIPKPVKDMERKLKWQAALMSTVKKAHRRGSSQPDPRLPALILPKGALESGPCGLCTSA